MDDRYELSAEIGRGGCAVIYEARDLRTGQVVAVKLIKGTASDLQADVRLAREARANAAIRHPNVVRLERAGELADGRTYLVMERLHGETLTQRLRRAGTLSWVEAIDMALQLLSALDAAHRRGIVHRDVKPDNVFLVPRAGAYPLVKLLDFGMCRRQTSSSRDDVTLTRAGQVVGTPEYMSPEQVSGKRTFDARIDLYAVGVLLYEVLSGQRAFPGKDAREVVRSVLVREVPSLGTIRPDVPVALQAIIARAMTRDALERYPSASEFQVALHELGQSLDPRTRGRTAPRVPHSDTVLVDEPDTIPQKRCWAFDEEEPEMDAPTLKLRRPLRSA